MLTVTAIVAVSATALVLAPAILLQAFLRRCTGVVPDGARAEGAVLAKPRPAQSHPTLEFVAAPRS